MMQRPGPHTHNCCGGRDVRFEQVGELLFDIRVTVTITYADGRTQDVTVPLTERLVKWTCRPMAGPVGCESIRITPPSRSSMKAHAQLSSDR